MHEGYAHEEFKSRADLEEIYKDIREDAEIAKSRSELSELYKHAGSVLDQACQPPVETEFSEESEEFCAVAETEFSATTTVINQRARDVGSKDDFSEVWEN